MRYILVASQDQRDFDTIRSSFRSEYKVDLVPNRDSCFDPLRKKRYEFIFIDVEFLQGPTLPNGHNDYKTALQPFWHEFPAAEIIVMASQAMIREAVMAVKAGASNYVTYPISPEEIKHVKESVQKSVRIQSELNYLRDKFWESGSLELIQTKSAKMRKVFDKIQSVAPTKSTVLLAGETGTGKGVLASLIHRHSNRREKQFISLHCGAIPDTLLESELFGHEKGAFTGAVRRKLGKFEIAHGGSIFLDEIGTITPSAQIKLLQVLQDRTFQRVGGEGNIEVDVRIIAATNTDLVKMCDEGLFRSDLYYRLSVFPIEIPPLRERTEDIPLLVEVFLRRLNKFNSKEIHDVDPGVMEALERYPWPGNIRELENLIERAYILERTSMLSPESFPSEFFPQQASEPLTFADTPLSLDEVRRRGIEHVRTDRLNGFLALLDRNSTNIPRASSVRERPIREAKKKHPMGGNEASSPSVSSSRGEASPDRNPATKPSPHNDASSAGRVVKNGLSLPSHVAGTGISSLTLGQARQHRIEEIEMGYLHELLAASKGRIKESAVAAGIGVRQLNKLMTRYGLRREDFRSSIVGHNRSYLPLAIEDARRRGVEEIERLYLAELLRLHRGRLSATAEAAGIGVRQLNKLMHRYGMRKEEFKSAQATAEK
jgi:DNA-binding NtrC family response regulator